MNLILAFISSGALGFIAYQVSQSFGFLDLEANDSFKKAFSVFLSFMGTIVAMMAMNTINFETPSQIFILVILSLLIVILLMAAISAVIPMAKKYRSNINIKNVKMTPSDKSPFSFNLDAIEKVMHENKKKPYVAVFDKDRKLIISGIARGIPTDKDKLQFTFSEKINSVQDFIPKNIQGELTDFEIMKQAVECNPGASTITYFSDVKEYIFVTFAPDAILDEK
ncbi:hypothetical protein R4Y45_07410 [Holzapfeliella sp. He02]|uniref:Uncharacterized protein n=1 Tax=Holzapfeliella saturejae TaxID=3082953 RepID=A0ABU8SI24_9LACO